MFDTSSFRIRYKAPVEKPLLIAVGPLLLLATVAAGLWNGLGHPISLGPWITSDLLSLLLPIAILALLALAVERLFGVDEGYPWQRSLAATGAGVVGGTLLVGAWGKVLDPASFAATLRLEGLTGWLDRLAGLDWLAETAAPLLVLALEILLGTLLVLGARNRLTMVASWLLVLFFLFLTGRAYWRDAHGIVAAEGASCGCFGNLLDRSPKEAFWQDVVLLVPGLLLALFGLIQRHTLGRRTALAVLIALAGAGFGWFAPTLPIDDLATRLGSGVEVSSMCTGRGADRLCLSTLVPELLHGSHVVVVIDLSGGEMKPVVDSLNKYWLADTGPRLWVLASGTPDQTRAFFWEYGPSFEIREVPPSLLRPLYRTLPRSFRVSDGEVTATWSGLPPLESWSAAGGADRNADTAGRKAGATTRRSDSATSGRSVRTTAGPTVAVHGLAS